MEISKFKEEIIFWSPYGYIEVEKEDYYNQNKIIIPFSKKSSKMYGSINKTQLKNNINIKLKTFYGERNTFNLIVNINDKIMDIIPKLCIEEDKQEITSKRWIYSDQYRIITTYGTVNEANILNKIYEERIKDNSTLILLNHIKISFSDFYKGSLIRLENKNKLACKLGGDEQQFVLADKGYSSGKHYCEFILKTEPYEKSVIIGVTTKRTEFNYFSSDIKGFYSFVLSDCKKMCNNTAGKLELHDYGDITKIGDRIGIMMEFKPSGLEISFYINKINMGVAFSNLPKNTYFPAVVLGFDGTIVRLTNNCGFPDM